MKKIKVSEASNVQLNWLMAEAKKIPQVILDGQVHDAELVEFGCDGSTALDYTTNWAQIGPIVEREHIELTCPDDEWRASNFYTHVPHYEDGPTPLVAAARCYVTSKLGDTVEVPEELLS